MSMLDAPVTDVAAPAMPPPQDFYQRTPDNEAKILALMRDKQQQWARSGREGFVRSAARNILFKRGHQWIEFNRTRGSWLPVTAKKHAGPRPVFNRYGSTMNAFTSVIARIEPTMTFRPATDDPDDRATAEISERVIEVIEEETNVRYQRQMLAETVGYTGIAWLESGYDPSPEHGTVTVEHPGSETCALCQAEGRMPSPDPMAPPTQHQVPIGKQFTEVASIFEMYFDPSVEDWTKQREYLREKGVDKATAERRWGAASLEGVSSDMGLSITESYRDMLPTIAGYMPETGLGAGQIMTKAGSQHRISERYYWALPTEDYPEGVLAIVLGGTKVVHLGPLPYRDDVGPFLPCVAFPIDPVPGSAYSKTPADDLALVAVIRNQLVAHMIMTMNRMAWPIWTVPEGANVATFTGEPGFIMRYNALGPNPAKPERQQGVGLPNGATTWLQYLDYELEELAAAYAGTKGDRQAGVSAGIALQMIEDRKNQRFGPLYILWEHAWAQWAKQQLWIFRQNATEPRLRKIQGRDSRWRIEKFMGADLKGRIDVVAEAGSGAPRSTLAFRAQIEQAAALGAINLADPEVKEKLLEVMNLQHLIPSMKLDAEMAARQIEAFEALAQQPQAVQVLQMVLDQAAQQAYTMGQPPQYQQIVLGCAQLGLQLPEIRPSVDGHAILAREFAQWLKGDDSQQLPRPIQKVVEMKHAGHSQILMQQQMQAMQVQGGGNPMAGFMNNPGGQQNAQNASGPARMQGEEREQVQAAQ